VNIDAPWPGLEEAAQRVLNIQTKLHRWAIDDAHRRFDDLYNLVCDPAFLVVAWNRVRGNKGARTAGVDGVKPRSIVFGDTFLTGLRADLKARQFVPLPVREKLIPKKSGKLRGSRHPDRTGPHRPGSPQAGARADLRGGLPAVFLRLPSRTPGPGRRR
jgi:RNA-directed DNA polymerase